ncbi:MAG: polysaccharide biosynthesis tyrosine autokinase [Victivallaceae bacterium]
MRQNQLDFNYILYLLGKYWILILSTTIIGVFSAFLFNELCTPLYRSTISLFTWNHDIAVAVKNIEKRNVDEQADKARDVMMYNNIISQSVYLGQRLIADYVNIMKNPYVKKITDDSLVKQGFARPLKYEFKCLTKMKSCIMTVEVTSSNKELATAAANALVAALKDEQKRLMNIQYAQAMHAATVPTRPFFPRKGLDLLLGFLAGIILGGVMAFVLDHLDVTIKTPDDLKTVNLLPLGSVPFYAEIDDLYNPKLGKNLKRQENSVLDAVRIINTTISFLRIDNPPKVIEFTSAMPGAGKSTQALLLGKVMGAGAKKVLLIDCDLRRPRIYKNIKLGLKVGLVDYLADNSCTDPEKYINKDVMPGLDLMGHGVIPPNPTELLGSKRFTDMIAKLREQYDCVILDSPPGVGMADTMVIGRSADAIIIVVDAGKTKIHEVVRNMEQLDTLHSKVIGAVLNKVNCKKKGSYYYNYGYYYTDYTEETAKA